MSGCLLCAAGLAVFYPPLPLSEFRQYDTMELDAIESFKSAVRQHESGEWKEKPRAMHLHRPHGAHQVGCASRSNQQNGSVALRPVFSDNAFACSDLSQSVVVSRDE